MSHTSLTQIVRLIASLILISGGGRYVQADEVNASSSTEHSSVSSEEARYTDWSVKWKPYPTSLPEWRASVTYVGASGPGEGLVASCGETGRLAYLSKWSMHDGPQVSLTDLRSGDTKKYQFPKLDLEEKFFEPSDFRWLSCSADGSRIAVSYQIRTNTDSELRRTFIVELDSLKVTALPDLILDDRFEINGRPISPSFNSVLGRKSERNLGGFKNVTIFPVEEVINRAKELRSPGLNTNFFLQDDSAFLLAAASPEPGKTGKQQDIQLLQFLGKQYSTVKKCSIRGMSLRYAQPAPSGVVITASNTGDLHRARPYLVKEGSIDGGPCDVTPLDEWSNRRSGGQQDDMPGYAGDVEMWASAKFRLPRMAVDTFGVKFYLSGDRTRPVLSTQIVFKGVGSTEEQPLVWMPLPVPARNQFTFVYGPHGANTAVVHLWQEK